MPVIIWSGLPGGASAKNPPVPAGDAGSSLGLEDPLEEGTATCSSVLVCRIPWTEEPGGLQSVGSQKHMTEQRNSKQSLVCLVQCVS